MVVAQSHPTLCDPMDRSPPGSSVHGDSPDKNTGGGCQALLQGILLTQRSNPGHPYYSRQILYHLRYQASPHDCNYCLGVRYLGLHNKFFPFTKKKKKIQGEPCLAQVGQGSTYSTGTNQEPLPAGPKFRQRKGASPEKQEESTSLQQRKKAYLRQTK